MLRYLRMPPPEPGDGSDDEERFSPALVERIVAAFSAPGDVVLDPFAGYGTTLLVSERMGRAAVGVELLPERVELIGRQVGAGTRILHGNSLRLADYDIGPVDLCMTSPPYMTAVDHPENPLTAYTTLDGHYPRYLAQLGQVFTAVGRLLRPGGHLVVNAANLETDGVVTPLAWDIARVVRRHLHFVGEIYLHWDPMPPETTGDYCLVFRADEPPPA